MARARQHQAGIFPTMVSTRGGNRWLRFVRFVFNAKILGVCRTKRTKFVSFHTRFVRPVHLRFVQANYVNFLRWNKKIGEILGLGDDQNLVRTNEKKFRFVRRDERSKKQKN